MKPWSFRGYQGYRCGQAQMGAREDSLCVRLSGALSQQHWRELYRVADHFTRLDLQVTVRPKRDAAKVCVMVHNAALRHSEASKDGPDVSIVRSNDGSVTTYLGSRNSDAMGRVYTKGVESGLDQYAGTARFEVEYKGAICRSLARSIYHAKSELITIAGYVSGFFSRRAVDLRLPSVPNYHTCSSRPRSDNARRLLWLREQVRPSVELLISAGCYNEVMSALGLSLTGLTSPLKSKVVHGPQKRSEYDA
jgi:DNA relaxase NicK